MLGFFVGFVSVLVSCSSAIAIPQRAGSGCGWLTRMGRGYWACHRRGVLWSLGRFQLLSVNPRPFLREAGSGCLYVLGEVDHRNSDPRRLKRVIVDRPDRSAACRPVEFEPVAVRLDGNIQKPRRPKPRGRCSRLRVVPVLRRIQDKAVAVESPVRVVENVGCVHCRGAVAVALVDRYDDALLPLARAFVDHQADTLFAIVGQNCWIAFWHANRQCICIMYNLAIQFLALAGLFDVWGFVKSGRFIFSQTDHSVVQMPSVLCAVRVYCLCLLRVFCQVSL